MSSDPTITPNTTPPKGSTRPVAAPGGADGPFPVPSPHAGAEGLSELLAPVPPNDVCGFIHNQWDIGRNLRRCIADAGHTQGRFAYDHGPWERVPEPSRATAPDAPSTPPAAPVPAVQRPEVAGEPESGEDGVAGREAALDRGRRYLVPVARFDLPGQPDDTHLAIYEWIDRLDAWVAGGTALCGHTAGEGTLPGGAKVTCGECLKRQPQFQFWFETAGCHGECWKAGAHTLRWGGCDRAVEPEPTATLSRIYTDPEDGQRSIALDRYTVAELAELIEPALGGVGIRLGPTARALIQDGHEVWLSSDEIRRLALAAADAIVTHSNRDAT